MLVQNFKTIAPWRTWVDPLIKKVSQKCLKPYHIIVITRQSTTTPCACLFLWDKSFSEKLRKKNLKTMEIVFQGQETAFWGILRSFFRVFSYALSHPSLTLSVLCPQKTLHTMSLWWQFKLIHTRHFAKILNNAHFWAIFEGFWFCPLLLLRYTLFSGIECQAKFEVMNPCHSRVTFGFFLWILTTERPGWSLGKKNKGLASSILKKIGMMLQSEILDTIIEEK